MPSRISIEAKHLRQTLRPARVGHGTLTVGSTVGAPLDTLSGAAQAVWLSLAPDIPPGLLGPLDRDLFSIYCEAIAMVQELFKRAQAATTRAQRNEALGLAARQTRLMLAIADTLALTPRARQRISWQAPTQPSGWEEVQ